MGMKEINTNIELAKNKLVAGNEYAADGVVQADDLWIYLWGLYQALEEVELHMPQPLGSSGMLDNVQTKAAQAHKTYKEAEDFMRAITVTDEVPGPISSGMEYTELAVGCSAPNATQEQPGLPMLSLQDNLNQASHQLRVLLGIMKQAAYLARDGIKSEIEDAHGHGRRAIESIDTWQGEKESPQS
jgi:hypothetical protein